MRVWRFCLLFSHSWCKALLYFLLWFPSTITGTFVLPSLYVSLVFFVSFICRLHRHLPITQLWCSHSCRGWWHESCECWGYGSRDFSTGWSRNGSENIFTFWLTAFIRYSTLGCLHKIFHCRLSSVLCHFAQHTKGPTKFNCPRSVDSYKICLTTAR